MRSFILIMTLILLSLNAFGQEVPAYLKDGTITVTLKDGKSYKFSSNEYAVVLRKPKAPVMIPVIGVVEQKEETPISKEVPQSPNYKNRIGFLVGYGLNGKQKVSSGPNAVDIEQKKGVVGGLILQHDLNKEYHILGEALTNETFMLGVGKGF
jgi:hypothetical protein